MNQPNILKQGLETAKRLINNQNYLPAIKILLGILQINPDNKEANSLLNQAQIAHEKEKTAFINSTLKKSKPLWKEKKYQDLYKIYESLLKFSPNNETVKNDFEKLSELLHKKRTVLVESINKKALNKINVLLSQKKYKTAMQVCSKLLKITPDNIAIIKLDLLAKEKYVTEKLKLKSEFIKNNDQIGLNKFYKTLLKIAPFNSELNNLYSNSKKHLHKKFNEIKTGKIASAITKIQELYNNEEIKKARTLCEKLQLLSPENKQIKKLLQKIISQDNELTEEKINTQLSNAQTKIKEDYALNKDKYIKI